MNLIDNEIEEKKQVNTTTIKIIIVSIVVLAIIGVVLYIFLKDAKSSQFKFYFNDTSTKQSYNARLFVYKSGQNYIYIDDNTTGNDEILISIKEMSNIMSTTGQYTFKQGAYNKYNESEEDCYIVTDNETVIYSADSAEVLKVIDGKYEHYTLASKVKKIGEELYSTIEGIELGFNVKVSKGTNKKNKLNYIVIEDLKTLAERYKNVLNDPDFEFSKLSFENKKAIKYDYAVIKNSKNEYGVKKISTGEIVIGIKYSDIKYIEDSNDFIITTPEKKYGIRSMESRQKDIEPQYVNIELIDNKNELYLLEDENEKKGVYSRNSRKAIIGFEYDDIGINSTVFDQSIENKYILYNNCIPCKKKISNEKVEWYLFDIDGKRLTSDVYDSIGYIEGTSDKSKSKNLLLIPTIEGIVVGKNNLYGIIKSTGTQLLPIQVNKIYSESITGEITYYAEYSGNRYNILKLPSVIKNANSSQQNQEQSNDKQNDNNTNTNDTVNNQKTQSNTTSNNTSNNSTSNSIGNNASNNLTNSNVTSNSTGNNTNQ